MEFAHDENGVRLAYRLQAFEASEDQMKAKQPKKKPPGSTNKQRQKQQQKQKQQQQRKAAPSSLTNGKTVSFEEFASMELFDFDCNLTHPDLADHVEELLARAQTVGVQQMLVPGATLQESQQAIDLCRQYPDRLFPTAGLHPYNALQPPTEQELASLRSLASLDEVCLFGEFGLDYSPGFPDKTLQMQWFEAQLDMACALKKPLFLHERLAHQDFVQAIDKCTQRHDGFFPPAIVHCFTGNEQELTEYLARDYYIGITGFICKKDHGASLRKILPKIPLNKLMVETDAPYMGFPSCRRLETSQHKKQYPNVPTALVQVIDTIAAHLNRSRAEIAEITTANARRFLRLL